MTADSADRRSGPLAGLTVLEVGGIGPMPLAGMILSDLGARVVRVDRPGGGTAPPTPDHWAFRGHESVVIDLGQRSGVDLLLRLVEHVDVLLEGYRPGVAERLGFGPEMCLAHNPKLVYGRITGWGQTGPLASAAGHDINYIALTGALFGIGPAGAPPAIPLNLIGDYGGGALFLLTGILAARLEVLRSGRGQVVDAAMVDGVAALMAYWYAELALGRWDDAGRGTNSLDGGAPFYNCYETADGGYVAVGAFEGQFYGNLLAKLGIDDESVATQMDRSRWPELRRRFASIFATRTRDAWVEHFAGVDACVTPVLAMSEAPLHPHNVARAAFVEEGGVTQPAPAPRFSRTPAAIACPPPAVGQHTDLVLSDFGVPEAEVEAL